MGLLTLNMILWLLTTFREYNFGGLYRKPLSESVCRKLSETAALPACLSAPKGLTTGISNTHKLNQPMRWGSRILPDLSHHLLNLSA